MLTDSDVLALSLPDTELLADSELLIDVLSDKLIDSD